jgi:hypothetical protein
MQVTKVGYLEEGNYFYHKNVSYKVIDIDYVFVKARKLKDDGFTYYFLTDIIVDRSDVVNDWKWENGNPNWDINDKFKR